MQQLLIATTNKGKLSEIKKYLSDVPVECISLQDMHITDDVEEDGNTYEENSQKKALFYAKKSGLPAISDDGGLEIDALGGEPGIHSKRWLGENTTEEALIEHMISVTKQLQENRRNARFVAVLSLGLPSGKVWSVEGVVNGIIAKKPLMQNVHGFPYRSFFYIPKIQKYYQDEQLTMDEQKAYNHRYKALMALKEIIKEKIL
jgi:XTP/dITP diphosphohydrolase